MRNQWNLEVIYINILKDHGVIPNIKMFMPKNDVVL